MKLPLPPEAVHRVLCGVLFGNTSKAILYFHYIEQLKDVDFLVVRKDYTFFEMVVTKDLLRRRT